MYWCTARFGGGWVWDDVAEQLASDGHRLHVVDRLPSAGTDPRSLGDMTADADHVRHMLTIWTSRRFWSGICTAGW